MSRLRALSLLLLVVMLASLVACGATEAPPPTEKPEEPAATEKPAEPAATEKPAEPTATEKPEEPQVTQTGYVIGLAVHENPAESSFWGW
jgi:basic membrane protein A